MVAELTLGAGIKGTCAQWRQSKEVKIVVTWLLGLQFWKTSSQEKAQGRAAPCQEIRMAKGTGARGSTAALKNPSSSTRWKTRIGLTNKHTTETNLKNQTLKYRKTGYWLPGGNGWNRDRGLRKHLSWWHWKSLELFNHYIIYLKLI